jgi:hypothetical protein
MNTKKFILNELRTAIIKEESGGKIYGIEANYSPYDFGPYTFQIAKAKCEQYMSENPDKLFKPRLYNDMVSELPAIDRMSMPIIDKNGNLYYPDQTPFSMGDLADY